jgi:hypothetical protein
LIGVSTDKLTTCALQSPEQSVTLHAAKALYQYAKDGGNGDEPKEIMMRLRGGLGDGGGIPVLIKLLTKVMICIFS